MGFPRNRWHKPQDFWKVVYAGYHQVLSGINEERVRICPTAPFQLVSPYIWQIFLANLFHKHDGKCETYGHCIHANQFAKVIGKKPHRMKSICRDKVMVQCPAVVPVWLSRYVKSQSRPTGQDKCMRASFTEVKIDAVVPRCKQVHNRGEQDLFLILPTSKLHRRFLSWKLKFNWCFCSFLISSHRTSLHEILCFGGQTVECMDLHGQLSLCICNMPVRVPTTGPESCTQQQPQKTAV